MNSLVEEIKRGLVEHAWQEDFTINGKNYKAGDEYRGVDFDEFRRGDIVIVSNEAFTTNNGIQDKTRPAVVIQNDNGNRSSDNIIVAYLTTQIKREDLPTHVVFTSNNGNRQMFMAEQLQTVKKGYTKRVAKVDRELLEEFDDAIITSLGLESRVKKIVEEAVREVKEDMQEEYEVYKAMLKEELEEENKEEVIVVTNNKEDIVETVVATKRVGGVEEREGLLSSSRLKVKEIVSDNFTYIPNEDKERGGLSIKHKRRSICIEDRETLIELIGELEELVSYL